METRLDHALEHAKKLTKRRSYLSDKPASVYIVGCHDFVKVGVAVDVVQRLIALQTGCPYELDLLASWKVEKGLTAESLLHKLWK